MSTLQDSQTVWSSISKENHNSKYEKCLNITEEIYKRINITFQIKKLETGTQSDISGHSDQIDSNELSNETDLFACDKTDSLPSSTEAEVPTAKTAEKYTNVAIKALNNNNIEDNLKPAYKKPRKKFRKRVKKRPPVKVRSDSEGSSSETTPLSRVAAPRLLASRDSKSKTESPDKKSTAQSSDTDKKDTKIKTVDQTPIQAKKFDAIDNAGQKTEIENVNCVMCNLPFRGVKGLRRHIAMSHVTEPDVKKEVKPNLKPVE